MKETNFNKELYLKVKREVAEREERDRKYAKARRIKERVDNFFDVVGFTIFVLLYVGFWVCAAYVAAHFIQKYW